MKLQSPGTVRAEMARRMGLRFGQWLLADAGVPPEAESLEVAADSAWPVRVTVGSVTEREALEHIEAVAEWSHEWERAQPALPPGISLVWEQRRWSRIGEQKIPVRLILESTSALVSWINQGAAWRKACARRDAIFGQFPQLRSSVVCRRHLSVFTDWTDADVARLQALLVWFERNPRSALYPRQLPVPGIDTKWLEPRRAVVRDFLLAAKGEALTASLQDFHEVCGLRKASAKIRLRILCPTLRAGLAGLCDIEAPVEEVARMALAVRSVIVVENLETGLALPDLDGTVAFMRLGHAISELARIPWLHPDHLLTTPMEGAQPPQILYWGDLDTHGFAILARARGIFGRLQSILMNEETFLAGRALWVREPKPHRADALRHLTPVESDLYAGIRTNRWGENLRLEQERLPWPSCLVAIAQGICGRKVDAVPTASTSAMQPPEDASAATP